MPMDKLAIFASHEEEVEDKKRDWEDFRDSFFSRKNIEQATDMDAKEIMLISIMEAQIQEYRELTNMSKDDTTPEEKFIDQFQNRRVSKNREGRREFDNALKREVEVREQEAIASMEEAKEGKKLKWI